MKQILIALLLIISVNSFSQTAEKQKPLVIPADSVAFVSQKDMDAFLKWLPDNMTHTQYLKLTPDEVITLFYRWAVTEYNKKKKN